MSNQRGYIPEREELIEWIRQRSMLKYDGTGKEDWSIGMSEYAVQHPVGWCGADKLYTVYGYTEGTRHDKWRALVLDLTGLHVPSSHEATNIRSKLAFLDEPLTVYDRLPRQTYDDKYGFGVFDCYEVEKDALIWHPFMKAYLPVGVRIAAMVR